MNVPRALLAVAIAVQCSVAVALDSYRVTALDVRIVPVRMNNAGDIAGYVVSPEGRRRAVLLKEGTLIDLGTLGGAESAAFGIDDDARVVGFADTASSGWRAFLFSDGTMQDLGTLPGGTGSVATGINASGQIVGYSQELCGDRCPSCPTCMVSRAFLYEDGGMKDLQAPGQDNWAVAINGAGDVAGGYRSASGTTRAFITRGGTTTDLGVGVDFANVAGINDHGHVVGESGPYTVAGDGCIVSGPLAFLWASGALFAPETSQWRTSRATAINNRDQVAGDASGCGTGSAFVSEAGQSHDLDALLTPGEDWHIERALAINDRGQIAAIASTSASPGSRPVLLEPVPSSSLPVAVEYFHAGLGHYFITMAAGEIAALDSGAVGGWSRTGLSFYVHPPATRNAADVCRFWSGNTFAPKSSHFYTPFALECEAVKANPDWTFEGEAFALVLPDATGRCPDATASLRRVYNAGMTGAPNHRYTTSPAVRADMIAQGWIVEGLGPAGVIGCVPTQ